MDRTETGVHPRLRRGWKELKAGKRPRWRPASLLVLALLLIGLTSFACGQSASTRGTVSYEEFQVALAEHLQSTGAAVYVSEGCSWCQLQKRLFGDAIQYVNVVYCYGSPEINPQRELCLEKGVSVTPTWEIGGHLYTGAKSLEELASLSGYEGPMPEASSSP